MKTVVQKVSQHLENEEVIEVVGFPIRVFCTKKPEYIKAILTHPQVGQTKAPQIMPRVGWAMRHAGAYILSGGEAWRKRRSQAQPVASPPQLQDYLKFLPQLMQPYLQKWQRHAQQNEVFDIFVDLRRLVTAFNFKMLFGVELDENELKAIEESTFFAEQHFVKPMPLIVPTPANLKFKRSVKIVLQALERYATRALVEPKEKSAVAILLKAGLKDEQLVGELASIYFGASVMSTSLAWSFYKLATHPEDSSLLKTEARSLETLANLSRESLAELNYSTAVLNETLRLYPPSWGYPRLTKEKFQLGEYEIPAGGLVVPMVYLTQRDLQWWPQPEQFRPRRFTEFKSEIKPNSFLPFGLGPRACLGAGLAPSIMQTILLLAYRDFDFEFCPRFEGDPVAEFGFEIHPQDKIMMRAKPER